MTEQTPTSVMVCKLKQVNSIMSKHIFIDIVLKICKKKKMGNDMLMQLQPLRLIQLRSC